MPRSGREPPRLHGDRPQPAPNIIGGVVITRDNRFIKILEVLPVNIYLKSPNDRQNIISGFAAYLKIAPDDLMLQARTLPAC